MQKTHYRGYDRNRKAIRYEYKHHVYLLKISEDPGVPSDIARDSGKFQRIYNSRTSAERYHGRMDRDFCFENHTIRTLNRQQTRRIQQQMFSVRSESGYQALGR